MIIMGYGRSGQLIAQLLSENMIPFVAVDAATDQVAKGKVRGHSRLRGGHGSKQCGRGEGGASVSLTSDASPPSRALVPKAAGPPLGLSHCLDTRQHLNLNTR